MALFSEEQKIFVVIAAYNEESMIGQVISSVKEITPYIIVVDDYSSDATGARAREAGAIVLSHPINLGQGAALQTGISYALRENATCIVHFDADGQMSAQEIESMVNPILNNEAEVTLGSRFLGETVNMPTIRKHLLKLGIIFTWIVSGIKLTDTHNGFRAMSQSAAKKIRISQNRMAHASEILDEIAKHELKYKEIPVTVSYTDYSQMKGQRSSNAVRIAFRIFFSRIFS